MVRLVVASADGRRILARPNGLAGWQLPAIPAFRPFDSWSHEAAARAEALLGVSVEAVRPLPPDAWTVKATGRVAAPGNTWIGVHEAGRLGADESVVRRWAASERNHDGPGQRGETGCG